MPHIFERLIHGTQNVSRVLFEDPAGFRRRDTARRTAKQLRAQLILEPQQLLTQRRLRDAQGIGGPGDRAELDDFEELLAGYGIVELQRTGRVALPKLDREARLRAVKGKAG